MQGIKNVLGKFRLSSVKTQRWHRTTYARICVGIDFNQSFLREMKRLITKDYTRTQFLDYEHGAFHCRVCFQHIATRCVKNTKANWLIKTHRKPKWWDGAMKEVYLISKDATKVTPYT